MTHHPLIMLCTMLFLWPHQVLGEEPPKKADLEVTGKNKGAVKAPSPAGNRSGLKWSEKVRWFGLE